MRTKDENREHLALLNNLLFDDNEKIEDNYPKELPMLQVGVKDNKLFGDFGPSHSSSHSRSKSSGSEPHSGNKMLKFRKNKNSKVIPPTMQLSVSSSHSSSEHTEDYLPDIKY